MGTSVSIAEPSIDMVQSLAADFRSFVAGLQTQRFADNAWLKATQQRCQELSERFGQLRDNLTSRRRALSVTLNDMRISLQKYAAELTDKYSRQHLKEIQAELVRKYEDFVAQVRSARIFKADSRPRFRSLRLPKSTRSIFHACMGLIAVAMYQFVLTQQAALTILLSLLSVFTVLEISRRFSHKFNDFMVYKLFGAISRPQERYKTNSASYYLLALTIITFIAPREAVCMAVLALAFGDPLASMVGNRWGRTRLSNDKSLEGGLAFLAVSGLAIFVYLLLFAGGLSVLQRLLAAVCVAGVGAFVELFSHKFDDNFTVPVACALAALIWF
jgi:dolichol kinase